MTVSDELTAAKTALDTAKTASDSAKTALDNADTAIAAATTTIHNARTQMDTSITQMDAAIVQADKAISDALVALGTTPPPPPPPTPTPPPSPTSTAPMGAPAGVNFKLVLGDDFASTTIDGTKWGSSGSWEADSGRGNHGNGEQDWKTPFPSPNYVLDGKTLTIVAKRDSSTHSGYTWTSGQLVTNASYTQAWIELRCQMPNLKGMCAAFWTWGAPGTNASAQEVDAFECYSDRTTHIVCTNHSSGGGGTGFIQPDGDLKTGMHVYGCDIRNNGIDWYFDGTKTGSTSGHPTQAFNIIIYGTVNAAMRAPEPDASTNEIRFPVDYCRVWQRS